MTLRIAGCDLGKASATFVVATVDDSGTVAVGEPEHRAHEGRPLDLFERWYREQGIQDCAALAATGLYAAELSAPVQVLPEDSCQEAALVDLADAPPSLNLMSVGARGYGVLSRRPAGAGAHVQYVENEKCSSGTGENMQRIASRFGLDLATADALAGRALGAVPITARCSVFAKSEMTHYANQGKPTADLLAGYFASVARNAYALLARNRVDGPVYLIGGCARIRSFQRALAALAGDLRVPDRFLAFEAIGAARLAARQVPAGRTAALPADPGELIRPRRQRFAVLAPAGDSRDRVTVMTVPAPAPDWTTRPAILGLDLGSTGAKAVLASIETGDPLLDLYDRTRGNPVDAARRLVGELLRRGRPDVRAIGVTGSGREAVAILLRAVFPEADRVVVRNEIVAHATAAIRCDGDGGRDLSVVEIGGQDAKYIRVQGGRIVESDLNKACSAGTGSFLEEQAQLYDVPDIEQFAAMARAARRPPDLGQMCTVYVADAAAEALRDGFELADLFAGFQYSVIHNYLDRVMGQRTLGQRVFLQGKPAANDSLAWTLAAVTGRDITVPPNPGAMGAWGIGLCAVEQLGVTRLLAAAPLDLAALSRAEITERSEFQCRDSQCQTLCPIERTRISVAGQERVAVSGGACPKFEAGSPVLPKLAIDAPNPFETRAALIAALEGDAPGRPVVAIPQTGATFGYLPWLAALVRELGFGVKILTSTADTLARGEQLCNSFDSCGPAKIAHALCDTDIGLLLFPKILTVADPVGAGGQTCVTEQAMPEMVEQALRARGRPVRVLRPRLSFGRGLSGPAIERALLPLADPLQVTPPALRRAVDAAAAAQARFEEALQRAGRDALAYARAHAVPSVVICGPLHVIHERALNATIPNLLRQNGALAIPADAYPVAAGTPAASKIFYGDPNRYLRAALDARRTGDVFPLMLSSFGCGPASFTEQSLQAAMAGYPHTILESDGHGGTAGFVTRIQAFLESVRQHLAGGGDRPLADNRKALSYLESGGHRGSYLDRDVRYVFLSSIDYLGPVFAATYRSFGYNAVEAPEITAANFACGRRDCSGKECLSYQMLWGAFRQYLMENPPPPGTETRLVQISGPMCRAGLFGIKDRISLEQMGLGDRVNVTALRVAGGAAMTARVWAGLAAVDIIRQLYGYHIAVESRPGEAEAIYREHCRRVVGLLEAPARRGWAGGAQLGRDWRKLRAIVVAASEAFARLARAAVDGDALRTVFVSGDIMTKGNDFANGGLYRELAARKVRVMIEPLCDFIEFLARFKPHMIFGRGARPTTKLLYRINMVAIRRSLYRVARERHPWLPMPDVEGAVRAAAEVVDPRIDAGAVLAVGNALHHWRKGHYDGVIMTACWGCDNGLIAESLLRHQRDIPSYFYYDDATPLDERRLTSFTFRLHRGRARSRGKGESLAAGPSVPG